MKKIFLGLLIGLGLTVAGVAFAAFNSGQLAPNAVNGNCLQTNGSINNWASCGAAATWTIGNGFIYNATSTDLVLIGTSTNASLGTLTVQGKGGTNPFAIASSTGTQLLTVTQAGNVGIGTSTPGSPLTVQPSSDSTDAIDFYRSGGTKLFNLDTTNGYGVFNYGGVNSGNPTLRLNSGSDNARLTFANTSTDRFSIYQNGAQLHFNGLGISQLGFIFTNAVQNAATPAFMTWTPVNDTNNTALTEINYFNYSAHTPQWALGNFTNQREWLINAPTYAFASASSTANTITTAATLAITGAPLIGSNMNFGTSTALWIQPNALTSSTTNGVGLIVNAPTGASNNYAALFNGGNVGIGTSTPKELLHVAGDILFPNTRTRTMTRTIPTVVNDEVDIGSFTFTNGAGNLEAWITVPSTSFSVNKRYFFPVSYNATANAWNIVLPIASTGAYSGAQDFNLEVNVNNNVASLRLRRTLGTTAGTALITIIQQGVESDAFTSSTATSSVSSITAIYTHTQLSQVNGKVGLGTNAPSVYLDVEGGTGGIVLNAGKTVIGGLTANTQLDVYGTNTAQGTVGVENELQVTRLTTASVSWPQVFNIGVGRWTTVGGVAPKTRVDFSVKDASNGTLSSDVTVMTLQSNGAVGIGTTAPATQLNIEGTNPSVRVGQPSTNNVGCLEMYDTVNTTTLEYIYTVSGTLTTTTTKPAWCQ